MSHGDGSGWHVTDLHCNRDYCFSGHDREVQNYPFLVLIIVSLGLALAVGMPMGDIVKSYEAGTGKTLGHLAIVIALGTMLGKMMAESGGAERIAITLIKWFGEKNIHWAMMFIALIVGLPVFFEVGFVLLIPIAFNIAKRTGKSLLVVGLPMVAGLSVVHGLIPPHPAALLAVQAYHADIGKTIAYSLIVGVPTAIVAGPLYALWINKYVKLPENNPLAKQFIEADTNRTRELPSFGITLFTIMLPVVLMLVGSWADLFFAPKLSQMIYCVSLVLLILHYSLPYWSALLLSVRCRALTVNKLKNSAVGV